MSREKPNAEGRLCGHLAAAMARAFHGDATSSRGMHIPNIDMTDFGWLANALLEIGVAEERQNPNGSRYPYFAMLPDQMPDFLERSLDIADPRIPRIITAFINCACGYSLIRGSEPLRWPSHVDSFVEYPRSFALSWFKADEHYRVAMQSFVRTGYAEEKEGLFRWTKKMSSTLIPDGRRQKWSSVG